MAKKTKRLSVRLTDREQIWAIIYLLFSYFLLPELLALMNDYLPAQLGNLWLNFLYFTINFLCILWIFGGFFKRSLIYAGQNIVDFLVAVAAASAVYWVINWAYSLALSRFFPGFANLNDGSISEMVHENFTIMFLGTAIFVPVAEEALHRGLIFGSLYPKSHIAAYILSTVIFASVHILGYVGVYSVPNLILAFLQYVPAGLTLAWAYRRSGSIFAPMLMHAVINALGVLSQR
jgi:membrane protease YdiL (CAAX protease family)